MIDAGFRGLEELVGGRRNLGKFTKKPHRNSHAMVLHADALVLGPDANEVGVDRWFDLRVEHGPISDVVVGVPVCFKIESGGEAEHEAELRKRGS